MHCISLNPKHLVAIKKLNYIPTGLGEQKFSNDWVTDKTEVNIAKKNPYYGEYTFHYSLWKSKFKNINDNDWIGFCQYRKFWQKELKTEINDFDSFNNSIIKKIPKEYEDYESIIGEPFFVNQFRFSKFIKRNFKKMFFSPSLLFFSNKRTIKFHFDMWHGDGNLDKAIKLLNINDRHDFNEFVNSNVSFNPHNMLICKSKNILNKYYESVFPWLEECESVFGFDNLKGFGLKRIYGFLAERYMSYWFQKYTKYKTMPIYFKDIDDFKL